MPMAPSGEARKSWPNDMARETSTTGATTADNRMGPKETDTRMEAQMNSTEVAASPSVSRPWAPMMPRVCAIM